MTHGTTLGCWNTSRGRCVTARPSRDGICPNRSGRSGRRLAGDRTATGSSWASWAPSPSASAACSEALAAGAPGRDVVLNILSRIHEGPEPPECEVPPHLPELIAPPIADCGRYDSLLSG